MHVVVIGCGIVGAAIAYELSQVSDLTVTVLDRQPPAQAATGAALGVLMGAICQRTKGKNLRMRLTGIQRYNTWVPKLSAITGRKIPFNQQGILRLCFAGEDLSRWRSLAQVRQSQGWRLQVWDCEALAVAYPYLNLDGIVGAVYSPDDRQLDPTAITLALVEAAQQNGVRFRFDAEVIGAEVIGAEVSEMKGQPPATQRRCQSVQTATEAIACDRVVLAAGLGTTPLTTHLQQPVEVQPVLGQAVRVRLPSPIASSSSLPPVITGNDVHLVPLENGDYWIGATVEFAPELTPTSTPTLLSTPPHPTAEALEKVMQQAIALCPALATGTIVQQWSGLRPRPHDRPAPVIEWLPGYENVILASGHYRNGVLLAPATAETVRQMICADELG